MTYRTTIVPAHSCARRLFPRPPAHAMPRELPPLSLALLPPLLVGAAAAVSALLQRCCPRRHSALSTLFTLHLVLSCNIYTDLLAILSHDARMYSMACLFRRTTYVAAMPNCMLTTSQTKILFVLFCVINCKFGTQTCNKKSSPCCKALCDCFVATLCGSRPRC